MSSDPPHDPPRPQAAPPVGAEGDTAASAWARVHDHLNEALELAPESRDAWFEHLAAEDAELAAEVRSLLAAHAASTGFLAAPPTLPTGGPSPGSRIGPYRVMGAVGHGGMGVVVRARRDDGTYTQDVAIKLIDPALRTEALLRRFRDERQILALLEHPHIARLLDGGTTEDGAPYLVMEFIEGRTLIADCDARGLTIDARLQLFLQICDAVQFAHQRLVVHRDLKSDNILVTADGSPRLLDFGVAKLLAADGGASTATLTAPMQRMLTPDYASPEQVRGEPASVAGDVYSLGVVLFELLTGQRPLRFKTRSPEEVLHVTLTAEPPRPSAALEASTVAESASARSTTPSALRRRLAGDLDYIVLKALEKDVARRYASVDQLARDVRRHASGHPVLARGQSTTYRMSRFVRRNRVAVLTSALVGTALVAGLVGTSWQAAVARRERDRAQQRFDDVRELARAMLFDLHDSIANLPGSTAAREALVRHALRYLDRLREESGEDLVLQREMATAYAKVGDVEGRPMFPNLGQSTAALAHYDQALALFERVTRAWPDSNLVLHDRLLTEVRRADLLRALGREPEALQATEAALVRTQEALARWPGDSLLEVDLAVARDRLFDQRLAAGDTSGAMEVFRAGMAVLLPSFAADPRDAGLRRALLIRYAKLGEVHAARGERDSALASYAAAETLALAAVAALPQDTDAQRDLSIVYSMHGMFLASGGALDAGLTEYGKGMQIAERLAASDPDNRLSRADIAQGHLELGDMLLEGGRAAAAEARLRSAFDQFAALAAEDPANSDLRSGAQQSGEAAARACERVASQSPAGDRARWRTQAAAWRARAARYASAASPDSSR